MELENVLRSEESRCFEVRCDLGSVFHEATPTIPSGKLIFLVGGGHKPPGPFSEPMVKGFGSPFLSCPPNGLLSNPPPVLSLKLRVLAPAVGVCFSAVAARSKENLPSPYPAPVPPFGVCGFALATLPRLLLRLFVRACPCALESLVLWRFSGGKNGSAPGTVSSVNPVLEFGARATRAGSGGWRIGCELELAWAL